MAVSKLENMFDPQVVADMIQAELPAAIRFTPLADVDDTLVGRPGSTITVPSWNYIGDAEDVAEGEAIPYDQLTTGERQMTIKKAGKGVKLTDEAILSGFGDPVGEAERQLRMAIANKVDNDFLDVMDAEAAQTTTVDALDVANLDESLQIFDDEDDEAVVLIANPKNAAVLRADAAQTWLSGTELGANRIVNGTFGEVLGAQVVRSKKLDDNTAFLVKRGALRLVRKRDVDVEDGRDMDHKLTKLNVDQHYGVYVYDPTKLVKITIGPAAD